jgi:D-glycero-alpha-D-manno-heptose 1-phosphate guanylyltransferase
MISEAIILAGGMGTRLKATVPDVPKCMAPVRGKPFLSYLIDYYTQQGITKFIFSLGYLHDQVEEFLEKKFEGSSSQYVVSLEKEPLGTGGAIMKACKIANSRHVLIVNGDTFFAVDVNAMCDFHLKHAADCTVALKPMTDSDRYGVVELDELQRISSFKEKKWYANSLINGGVYALYREIFITEIHPVKFSFETEYLERLYAKRQIFGFIQDKYFIDIGIPEDYYRAQEELPKNV